MANVQNRSPIGWKEITHNLLEAWTPVNWPYTLPQFYHFNWILSLFAFFDLAQSCIVQPCWVLVFFIILKNVIMYAEKFNMLNGLSVIPRPVQ